MFGITKASYIFSVISIYVLRLELCRSMEMKTVKGNLQFLRLDGSCKYSPDTAIIFNLEDWKTEGKDVIINSTFEVTRDVTDMSFILDIERCRSKENPDSCQNVYTIRYKDACQLLTAKSMLWTPFFSKISPEWKCPLRKGNYTQTSGRFDITPCLFLPVQGWYWKTRSKFIDKRGKVISCIDVLTKVTKAN